MLLRALLTALVGIYALAGPADACVLDKVCGNSSACQKIIDLYPDCPETWKDAACTVKGLIGLPVFTSGVAEARIYKNGTASIHAEFSTKADIKEFFKTFANAKAVVQTAIAASCTRPKALALSVQLTGQAFSFMEAVGAAAGATTDDSVDQFWLDESVEVKSAVLAAATGTASLTWNPFDPADKGQLIRLDALLDAALLPPPDGLQLCKQECEYLHRMLGNGTLRLSGGIDTDQDDDFDDDDDLVGRDVDDDFANQTYAGDVIKFFLKGSVDNAIIPLNKAGAELEDLGLVFRLQIPKTTRRARRNDLALARAPRQITPICPIDLMILVDRSGSIFHKCPLGYKSFRCWEKMKDFLRKLVDNLPIGAGPNNARVGINHFSTCGTTDAEKLINCGTAFGLEEHSSNSAVVAAINTTLDQLTKNPTTNRWRGGSTHTKQGMEVLRKTLIKESFDMANKNPLRANPRRLVLVLTDGGYSNPSNDPESTSKLISNVDGIDVMAVGVGEIKPERIAEIASNPSLIRPAPCTPKGNCVQKPLNFDMLVKEVGNIADEFCTTSTPGVTTSSSTSPATTQPATTTQDVCGVDLAFVVDMSGSINDLCNQVCGGTGPCDKCWPDCKGHEECWDGMKEFIAQSTRQLDIGSGANQTQVAMVSFSSTATVEFDFNDHSSNNAVSAAVDQLVYERCLCKDSKGDYLLTPGKWCQPGCEPSTHTSLGLERAQQLFADASSGVRSASTTKRVVVVITDGESNPGYSPIARSAELAADGVTVIGVGVNLRAAGLTELSGLAGSNSRVLSVTNFGDLPKIVSDLRDLICSGSAVSAGPPGGGPTPPPPPTGGGGGGGGGPIGNSGPAGCSTVDGYIWSLAITATLKLAERTETFVTKAGELTINTDGSGVLLPGDVDETNINAGQLQSITNDALRLRGEIGFRVKGKDISCLKKSTGRFYFGLADGEALMQVFGNPYVHIHDMSIEVKWNFGEFPYMRELLAQGQLYIGSYGHAALCVLDGYQCAGVVAAGAQFTLSRDVRKGTNHFGFFTYLRPQGTNALVEVYDAISDKPLPAKRRQWLALLSAMDYGLEIDLVTGAKETLSIELVGTLTAAKLPPLSQDNLVDGDCNVACQLLHDALGAGGTAQVTVSFDRSEADGVTLGLDASIEGASIVLASNGGSPSVTLTGLSFGISIATAGSEKEFKIGIGASVDIADGPKLTGEIGFSVADSRRIRRDGTIAAYFKVALLEPYYEAFDSESTHIVAFGIEIEVSGGNGQGMSLPNLMATGELCLGTRDVCEMCQEASPESRVLDAACQGPVFVGITVGVKIPGQSNIDDPDALTAAPVCKAARPAGNGWEFFIEARVEASNGVGALARIQNALAGDDASTDSNDRMNTFAAATFVLRLTLGPSRVKLSVEAQLNKLNLPAEDTTSDSTTCDMICQMCHKLLDNADPGSYIFVKGEFGATISPFSLSVAVGAGFNGRIEYPDKGLTLLKTGITLIFEMDKQAISFEIRLYGSFIKEQTENFGAADGIEYTGTSNSSVVRFRDPYTTQVYGQTTRRVMNGFTMPLMLDGAFALKLTKGRKGSCNSPSTPGTVNLVAAIEFSMIGWKMKFLGKRCHIGNVDFKLALQSTPPYFNSFAGQAEICFGTTGRCAQCILGSSVADCDRTIYLAAYVGVGDGNNFARLELFSTVSLRGFLETFDLDRLINLPNGLNIIEFGPRPGQRAAIFSLSGKKRVIDKGFDVLTQTYTGNTVTIPMGLMIDGRVTLFPDVSWLRWSADLILILGAQRLLIDYTQTPISWGCDSSGSGCIFELTGYDHTPSKPQGPRFYINVAMLSKRDDVPDMSTEEMYEATGKQPLDSGGRRNRRDDESVLSRTSREAWDSTRCSRRYVKLSRNATFTNSPLGKHRGCNAPEYDGVFESATDYSYLDVDINTLRVSANQEHKFKRQLKGGYNGSIVEGEHLFGSLRDCTPNSTLKGVGEALIDLNETFFAITGQEKSCVCRGHQLSQGSCSCGQWEAVGHNVIMEVNCDDTFQVCRVLCGGSSGECRLKLGYLQLRFLDKEQSERFRKVDSLVQHGRHSPELFASDANGCKPTATCCDSWCQAAGFPEFWPTHSLAWNCCGYGRVCCGPGNGFPGQHCNSPLDPYNYKVDAVAREGSCDPRPYCTFTGTRTPTVATTTGPSPVFPKPPGEVPPLNVPHDVSVCSSVGDPHFITFSNHRYDYYGVGVHMLFNTSSVTVEVVHKPWGRASVNTALTLRDHATGSCVTVYSSGAVTNMEETCNDKCFIGKYGNEVSLWHNNSVKISITTFGGYMNIHVIMNTTAVPETTFGLCGTARGTNKDYTSTIVTDRYTEDTSCYTLLTNETFEELNTQTIETTSDECDAELLSLAKRACAKAGVFVAECIKDVCLTGNTKIVQALIEADATRNSIGEALPDSTTTPATKTIAPSAAPTAEPSVAPSRLPTTTAPTATPTPVPTSRPTRITIGVTPFGDKCKCECRRCDPPPVYKPLPRSAVRGKTPLASVRVGSLQECQRACALRRECRAITFDAKTMVIRFAFFNTRINCNLYASSSKRLERQSDDPSDDLVVYEKEQETAPPVNDYVQLPNRDDEHHDGTTLSWTATVSVEQCTQACDETVKCVGVSLYTGINDSQNCRLMADDMVYGPWTPVASGPWSTTWYSPSCENESVVDPNQYRWNESVTIISYVKQIGSENISDDFVSTSHGDDEVFTGETLYWSNASTEERCVDACSREALCTGITLYPNGTGVNGMQCRLAASPMDDDAAWMDIYETRRHRRLARRPTFFHRIKRRPIRLPARRPCICWNYIGTRPPTPPSTRRPTPPPQTPRPSSTTQRHTFGTTAGSATTVANEVATTAATTVANGVATTLAATPRVTTTRVMPTFDPAYTLAIMDDITCVGVASQTCILIHARTKILGLIMRVKIQMAKNTDNKWMASLDADGSLFGSFLQATFQVRVALSKPRSFRALGSMVAQSKEEVLNRVKAKLQEKADESTARFAARRAAVEQTRAQWDAKIAQKKAIVDSKRAIFDAKSAAIKAKADNLAAKRAALQTKKQNLNNVCSLKCCSKSCEKKRWKRIKCNAHNAWCKVKRAGMVVLVSIAQAAVAVAEAALRAAAAVVSAAKVILDAAILVLEGVRRAGQAALSVAQAGLNALEKLVKFGLQLAAKILEGAFNLFYFNEFSFDFQLSRDAKYFKYHLDCTLFGKRIVLDSTLDFSSVGSAVRSLIGAIVDLVKALFSRGGRRRRIAGDDAQQLLLPMGSKGNSHDYLTRRDATSANATGSDNAKAFQTVCDTTCVCTSCVKSVKTFFSLVLGHLLHTKGATDAVRRAAMVTDSLNTESNRKILIAESINEFKAEALANRTAQHKQYASVADECAGDDNVTACVLITNKWEADLDAMSASDEAIAELLQEMKEEFAAEDFEAQQYRDIAADAELLSWRDTVTVALINDTQNGIGCAAFECVDVADCAEEATNYLLESLEALADDSVCPDGYTSDDGGCDRSAALVQQHAARLAEQWRSLAPSIGSVFVLGVERTNTLSDAIELMYKARSVLNMLAPAEVCEGRTVVMDDSETVSSNETDVHAMQSESYRARLPAAPVHNVVLHQLPRYSSICAGSGLSLTDGLSSTATTTVFSTCNESSPYIEIPTSAASIVEVVRLSKQCDGSQSSDPSVLGLLVQVKTHAGVFTCGDGLANAADAACDGRDYWERACDFRVPSTAVVVMRQGVGSLSIAKVEADGQASFVSNVLLGQPVSSTSQCHERPTFKPLLRYNDMFPSTPAAIEIVVNDKLECLDACAEDVNCVGVSFIVAPFLTTNGNNCIMSPNALLGDDVVFSNIVDAGGKGDVAYHFSKHVPFHRLESFVDHVYGGPLLSQSCVRDLAGCKAKCAEDMRCTGFTFFGDEDEQNAASVCTMAGISREESTAASKVFADGPFVQMPPGGISANLGRAPRPGESSEYNMTESYAIMLGLDKVTDGFYQPLASTLMYMRQGFLHTCGETASDEVVVRTAERSSVHAIRVWKRCDCCENRGVGLQVMQQVEITTATTTTTAVLEWRPCGEATTATAAACDDEIGPEAQFWQRSCDHTLATTAIKIVRVGDGPIDANDDPDYRSIDLPEIEAFGTFFVSPANAPTADEDLDLDPDAVMEMYYSTTVPSLPVVTAGCDASATTESSVPTEVPMTQLTPLIVCTVGPNTTGDDKNMTDITNGTDFTNATNGTDFTNATNVTNTTNTTDVDNDDVLVVQENAAGDDSLGAIVGAIVGVILLLMVVVIVVVVRRKRAERGDGAPGKEPEETATKEKQMMFNPLFENVDTVESANTDVSPEATHDEATSNLADGYLDVSVAHDVDADDETTLSVPQDEADVANDGAADDEEDYGFAPGNTVATASEDHTTATEDQTLQQDDALEETATEDEPLHQDDAHDETATEDEPLQQDDAHEETLGFVQDTEEPAAGL